ncbi:MAG: hypothetical protein SF182_13305 [Deltaproteobacteria bacterium]|nr:hypothetical protein [Deltaproteobacteria bacterium]
MRPVLAVLVGIAGLAAFGRGAAGDDDPFVDFKSPITNPVNFEDPRATSEIRPIYAHHHISAQFANDALQQGGVDIVALQLRYAINDRWAIIATKDGYVWLRPNHPIQGVVQHSDGWANIAFGAKYAFWRDAALRAMGTVGLRYEAPSGNAQGLQGPVFINSSLGDRGNGSMNPFLSALWGTGDLHLMGYSGFRFPLSDVDTMFFDLSLHADYTSPELTFAKPEWKIGTISPTIELNWVQALRSGDRIPLNAEGFDFFNLGSSNVAGTGVVTMGFGARWRFVDDLDIWGRRAGVDFGAAYELPITNREWIFGWRVTTDLIFWMV